MIISFPEFAEFSESTLHLGKTPLWFLVQPKFYELIHLMSQISIWNYSLTFGSDTNGISRYGFSSICFDLIISQKFELRKERCDFM